MPITFLSNNAATAEENGTGIVRNIQASLDGAVADAGISYSITGGADQALFAVNSTTGELSFIAAPDFEAPTDTGGDNIYNVTVTATGAGPSTASQDLTVTVTNDTGEAAFNAAVPVVELSSLDGSNGFVINGIDAGDRSGISVSNAGDINGDGFDDVIIGALQADPNGINSGESYVVFGKASGFGASINLSTLDGSNGFVINGVAADDESGSSVSSAGDVNGDGFDDLIIGAYTANANGVYAAGESYIVFGKASSFGASLDLSALDGSNGFVIKGIDASDYSGRIVSSAGDVNGDGYDDLIIGADYADPNGNYSGESYVVFGKASGFGASLNLSTLDGNNGFVINGIDANDYSGFSVSSAGDVNGDGFADLIIGAHFADPNGASKAGESYIVFGKASGFSASLNLSTLDGSNGFVINGIDTNDQSGRAVSSAGDVNGDGYDDLIIGANGADQGTNYNVGESYVVFGKASGFDASLNLSTLDGTNGFILVGIDAGDFSGGKVSSAGDVNGDGFADLIISAYNADPNGSNSGETYILFGKASGFAASLNLSTLDGSDGFILNGIDASDQSGNSVSSAGDVNGDGYDDLIIGASRADPNGASAAGESYVVFGGASLAAIQFNSLASANFTENSAGFVRNIQASLNGGAVDAGLTYSITGGADQALFTVNSITGELSFIAAPDFEIPTDAGGDNIYNVTVTATGAGPSTASQGLTITVTNDAVEEAVSGTIISSLELSSLNGTNGFVINGIDAGDRSGISVSNAGDVNGDGFDDLIIGARYADPNGSYSGESYVVFGKASGFGASLELSTLDGTNGFVINGIDTYDRSGKSVSSAGDINGDGYDDLIIGARYADPNGSSSGESYIVFGKASGFAASFDLSSLDGANGFVINGIDAGDQSGISVSSAGDVNGDGYADLIIGTRGADPNGANNAGESYVVFGKASGFGASLELSSLDGTNGFVLNGIDASDLSGVSVSSAGDVNGDGYDDLIIGAYFADPNGASNAGESYVVFGTTGGFAASINLSTLDGSNGFVINGIDANDYSGLSVSSAGDVNGDGFADLIIGAHYADPNGSSSGESYIVFGKASGFGASLELSALDGSNGFVINGIDANDHSGVSVSSAGDVNGDGYDDLIIGARSADPNGSASGASYVVFGAAGGFAASLDLSSLDGSSGFVINGIDAFDYSGRSVSSAGDINGDGYDDLIIGANYGDANGSASGESYVIFGGASLQTVQFSSTATASFAENGTGVVRNVEASLNGGAVDAGLSYSITSGADMALFAVDGSTGELTFVNAPDFETPGDAGSNNVYEVQVTTSDGGSNSNAQALIVTVTDVNEVPAAEPIDDPVTTSGSSGSDVLTGGSGSDTLVGGAGDDLVSGGAGDDVLFAGPDDDGDDTVDGGSGDDVIGGAAGDDFIEGGDGSDTLYGGSGNDIIYTTSQNNENGDLSSNVVWAGSGDDSVTGGLGADTIGGGAGDDIIEGGRGSDTVYGGAGADTLSGDGGNDALFAGSGDDNVSGGDGADEVFNGVGNDTVAGDAGNDTLWGGAGNDIFSGGTGADTFIFSATSGEDTVSDFNTSEDTLNLRFAATDFTSLADVEGATTLATLGGTSGVLIDTGGGNSVFLEGLALDDLTAINLMI